jgi:cell division protein FtsL
MNHYEKTKCCVMVVIIGTILVFEGVILNVGASGITVVNIDPSNQTINASDTFTVNVSCVPGQPIKSFEFKLSFNPLILQANSVIEGDIFNGYATFFNSGTLDNVAGTIVDVYDLIVGSGNDSNAGILVTISFTAQSNTGTSILHLYDVGVTQETEYIPITVNDGSVAVQGTSNPNPPDNPPGGPSFEPPTTSPSQNNPPMTPNKPSGPTFVERGVVYTYTSSTSDPDGDLVRLKFDWGDGGLSNWTALVASNTSVSLYHAWNSISTYVVRVIAQDGNGSNSSWSSPLTVTVSQAETGDTLLVLEIIKPENVSVNQTIQFDATSNFNPDVVIVSYYWDFGDGTTGAGKTTNHTYNIPGTYMVVLIATDDSGNTYSKNIILIVGASTGNLLKNNQNIFSSYLTIIFLLIILGVCASFLLYFRDNIRILFSERYIIREQRKIKQLNTEMTQLTNIMKNTTKKRSYVIRKKGTQVHDNENIEKKVDEIIISKIEEKIDKM